MSMQVDASTVSAGAFFAESNLLVPDYQRSYSWEPKTQIDEFWSDLSGAVGAGEYFLGLIILADASKSQEVVDGQQRLVTLMILANALRLVAVRTGRKLVAESLRTRFLYAMDFQTEHQALRIDLTDAADSRSLHALLKAESIEDIVLDQDSAIDNAHARLMYHLNKDLDTHDNPELRVGQWSEFITKRVTFAVFKHPDRSAAFRVYEVINTRGKVLTPTELIKSYLIGTNTLNRDDTYARWKAIEVQLDALGELDQLTTFVRHVVTLRRGYVIPRELYDVVTANYEGVGGVEELLASLERHLPTYSQMLDPAVDVESSELQTRAFILAKALSMSRFRPILLEACLSAEKDELLKRLLEIVVPGVLAGAFGTGNIEAQFARSARRIHQGSPWSLELRKLSDLRPPRDEFVLKASGSLNKFQAHVLRSAYLQGESIPTLDGFPHLKRPRNATGWAGFDDDQFTAVGTQIGNWVLTETDRRPPGARSFEGVVTKIFPKLIQTELDMTPLTEWRASDVQQETSVIIEAVAELWYGPR